MLDFQIIASTAFLVGLSNDHTVTDAIYWRASRSGIIDTMMRTIVFIYRMQAAIAEGEIGNKMLPTHVAFTLESIMLFFFLSYNHVRLLGNFEAGQEIEYLYRDMNSFLESLKK